MDWISVKDRLPEVCYNRGDLGADRESAPKSNHIIHERTVNSMAENILFHDFHLFQLNSDFYNEVNSIVGIEIIPLTRGMFTIIDEVDLPLLPRRKWQAFPRRDRCGFYVTSRGGIRMHRFLMNPLPEQIVDHINGNGLDNRRINLRIGTQSQNCVNRKRTPGNLLRGVRLKKGLWQAKIKYKGREWSLGYYRTEIEAHYAYVKAAKDLHGEWMPLPEPPEVK